MEAMLRSVRADCPTGGCSPPDLQGPRWRYGDISLVDGGIGPTTVFAWVSRP